MTRSLDGSDVVARAPGIFAQRLDDEIVLLDAERGRYFALNASGATIWDWLGDEGATVSSLRTRFLDEYEAEPAEVERDLVALLGDLDDKGLIEIRPASSDR